MLVGGNESVVCSLFREKHIDSQIGADLKNQREGDSKRK
jgi:hypothetical protein